MMQFPFGLRSELNGDSIQGWVKTSPAHFNSFHWKVLWKSKDLNFLSLFTIRMSECLHFMIVSGITFSHSWWLYGWVMVPLAKQTCQQEHLTLSRLQEHRAVMSLEMGLLLLNVNRPCPGYLSKRPAFPHTASTPWWNFSVYLEHDYSFDFHCTQPHYSSKFSSPQPSSGNPPLVQF